MNDHLPYVAEEDEARCSEFSSGNGMNKKKVMNHLSRADKGDESQCHHRHYSPNVMYEAAATTTTPSARCKLHFVSPQQQQQQHQQPFNAYPSTKKYLNSCNHQYETEARYNSYCNDEANAFYLPKTTTSNSNSSFSCRRSPPPPSLRVFLHKQQFANNDANSAATAAAAAATTAAPTPAAACSNSSVTNSSQQHTHSTAISLNDVNRNTAAHNVNVSEISVMLKNRVAVCLEVANCSSVSCRDLMSMMIEEPEVGLAPGDGDMFALWMVSSLFEVQLKPDHRPLNVWKKWPELLAKYTTASEVEREKDCPHLSLQRDVFYPKRDEMRLGNCLALELLYEEAKWNILCGRYPCDQANALRLAGLQARIELGKYDPEIHTPEYFKSRLNSFLPSTACKSKWSILNFGSKSGVEYRLLRQFRECQDDVSHHAIIRQYMDICWNLLFYGCAFFTGQLEKPVQGLAALIGYQDTPVVVAINREGVSIIAPTESKVLLGLRYQDLSWDSARPSNENNPNCLPCLFLQFQLSEGGQRVFKVLQVFSKQAILMDAIISSFVRALRQSWDRDEVDYSVTTSPGDCTPDADDAHTPLTTSSLYGSAFNDVESNLVNNLHRLSLATFNEDGDCIKLMGSWQFRAST